jgi:hypothetical protein
MSLKNAMEFIIKAQKDLSVKNVLENQFGHLKSAARGAILEDKEKIINQIVQVGSATGHQFTAAEYLQAAELLLIQQRTQPEELGTMSNDLLKGCACTGCAACAACVGCLACVSCAWCIVVPFGGEAVIAADAAAVIMAATTTATTAAVGVAVAAQSN